MVKLDDLPRQKPELGICLVKADKASLEDNIYPQPKPYVPREYKGGWIGLTLKTKHRFNQPEENEPSSEYSECIDQNTTQACGKGKTNENFGCNRSAIYQQNNYWPSWDDESVNECEDNLEEGKVWEYDDQDESDSEDWPECGIKVSPTKDDAADVILVQEKPYDCYDQSITNIDDTEKSQKESTQISGSNVTSKQSHQKSYEYSTSVEEEREESVVWLEELNEDDDENCMTQPDETYPSLHSQNLNQLEHSKSESQNSSEQVCEPYKEEIYSKRQDESQIGSNRSQDQLDGQQPYEGDDECSSSQRKPWDQVAEDITRGKKPHQPRKRPNQGNFPESSEDTHCLMDEPQKRARKPKKQKTQEPILKTNRQLDKSSEFVDSDHECQSIDAEDTDSLIRRAEKLQSIDDEISSGECDESDHDASTLPKITTKSAIARTATSLLSTSLATFVLKTMGDIFWCILGP